MSRQRVRDTTPEVALRRLLHSRGRRFRIGVPVPGLTRRSIDVAFPRQRVAVFIDGCFWHGCPEHCVPSKTNAKWWAQKLDTNRQRDAETTQHLENLGWQVVRVWEHEAIREAADRVERALRARTR
ncbi:DNA mismatch repair protein Vsr [Knoellia sinensis KCTC 19936]|uniref:DNA mismatch repair protein Vsr n=2 Tax=Knoellia TaxID=136099 RepID=A0A0A0J1H9_9MICO|nr:very short patch repair endonuclease [Knoellia sinensis]KGN30539.1 DNA mismatch repair protein Vsr [Knoellia sinensis KCTC 19936]